MWLIKYETFSSFYLKFIKFCKLFGNFDLSQEIYFKQKF